MVVSLWPRFLAHPVHLRSYYWSDNSVRPSVLHSVGLTVEPFALAAAARNFCLNLSVTRAMTQRTEVLIRTFVLRD